MRKRGATGRSPQIQRFVDGILLEQSGSDRLSGIGLPKKLSDVGRSNTIAGHDLADDRLTQQFIEGRFTLIHRVYLPGDRGKLAAIGAEAVRSQPRLPWRSKLAPRCHMRFTRR